MSRKELYRRYLLVLCSVFINSLGISVITKAMLGTTAISSVPYVLSLFTPGTMGQYTIYMSIFFILLSMTMMKRSEICEKRYELISQIPIGVCFGLFIDLFMHGLLGWLLPGCYLAKIATLLAGSFILGLGISLEVKADVSMVSGDYLVQVISRFIRKDFGFVKVCFDVTLVLIACTLSLSFLSSLEGVREGTVIAALVVGPISHVLHPCWKVLDGWLQASSKEEMTTTPATHPFVITIAREYGSGGRLLGKMLAEKLGFRFYDKELIALVAKDSQLSERCVEENEQRASSNRLLDMILCDYEAPMGRSLSHAERLFVAQSRVIRRIVREQSCVIIGRCADYVLKDIPETSIIKVFCYMDMEDAKRRCVTEYGIPPGNAEEEIRNTNHARISHYQYYTGRKWGDPHCYDLMINTGAMPLPTVCALIVRLYESKMREIPKR